MDLGVISVRYGRALLKSATADKVEDQVYNEMQALASSYIDVPGLRSAITNPLLTKATKESLLLTACGGDVSTLTKRFVALVLRERRESDLQFMANAYITLYRKQKNIIRGKLTTATPVSKQTEDRMREMVEKRAQGTVEFQTEVDADIMGGFILEYDTYKMDASVKRKLHDILAELKK